MSGRATLTTVTSSSSMKVAIETRTRVHHFRSIAGTLDNDRPRLRLRDQADQGRRKRSVLRPRAPEDAEMRRSRNSDGEVAELLANALVEARAWQLGEA